MDLPFSMYNWTDILITCNPDHSLFFTVSFSQINNLCTHFFGIIISFGKGRFEIMFRVLCRIKGGDFVFKDGWWRLH